MSGDDIERRLVIDTGFTVPWGHLYQLARNNLANTLLAMGETTPWRRNPVFAGVRFAVDRNDNTPWLVYGKPQAAVPINPEGVAYLLALRKENE